MIQNQSQKPKTIRVRYTRHNPPSTVEEAFERMDRLGDDAQIIETNIEQSHPEDYQSDEEYQWWKKKAVAALAFTRGETKFLKGWVKQIQLTQEAHTIKGPSSSNISSDGSLDPKKDRILDLISQSEEVVKEINYVSVYTRSSLPENENAAHDRVSELSALRFKIDAGFSEINAICSTEQLGKAPAVKAPLQSLLYSLNGELSVLKNFLRIANDKRNDWLFIIAGALSRAVDSGFAPTAEEHRILLEIQEKKKMI